MPHAEADWLAEGEQLENGAGARRQVGETGFDELVKPRRRAQ